MLIRQEVPEDFDAVYNLIKAAFATAEHSDFDEHELVVRLRGSKAYVPQLSLVAVIDETIAGHILFSKVQIGESCQLALAPLAVAAEHRKKGVGAALIEYGHAIARGMGYAVSVVLGSAEYYGKSGYTPADEFGISAPFEVPRENFMAYSLCGEPVRLCGCVEYAKEFFTK